MLEVFRRKGVVDVCCVVTRYFGGILLGAGRLSRAYSDCAGKALADAGIAQYRLFARIELTCAYSLIGRVTSEAAEIGCVIENVEYGERVVYSILAPVERADAAKARLADTLAGTDTIAAAGEKWMVI
jgi:putative IMPACT (imprinted ancient) family translation regulator